MPPHTTWLNYVPGYEALEHWVQQFGGGWFFRSPAHVQHLAAIILVALLMLILTLRARRGLARSAGDIIPDEKLTARNFVELMMETILSVMEFTMSREAALRHFWLVGTLAFFILFSNFLGLIPGFIPPTENLNTNFACATFVFVYYNFYAFKRLGLGHLAHMANPAGEPIGWVLSSLFLVVEIISHCIRPVALSIRLMANMAGDHLVLGVFVGIFPLLLPIPVLLLGLIVVLIQALIFVLLSSVYIGEVEANIEHHLAARGHGHGSEAAAH